MRAPRGARPGGGAPGGAGAAALGGPGVAASSGLAGMATSCRTREAPRRLPTDAGGGRGVGLRPSSDRLDTCPYTGREYERHRVHHPSAVSGGPDPHRRGLPPRRGDDVRLVREPDRALPQQDRRRRGRQRQPRDGGRDRPVRRRRRRARRDRRRDRGRRLRGPRFRARSRSRPRTGRAAAPPRPVPPRLPPPPPTRTRRSASGPARRASSGSRPPSRSRWLPGSWSSCSGRSCRGPWRS